VPATVMMELLSGPTDEAAGAQRQQIREAFDVEPVLG
jgi:hypothetical protein